MVMTTTGADLQGEVAIGATIIIEATVTVKTLTSEENSATIAEVTMDEVTTAEVATMIALEADAEKAVDTLITVEIVMTSIIKIGLRVEEKVVRVISFIQETEEAGSITKAEIDFTESSFQSI